MSVHIGKMPWSTEDMIISLPKDMIISLPKGYGPRDDPYDTAFGVIIGINEFDRKRSWWMKEARWTFISYKLSIGWSIPRKISRSGSPTIGFARRTIFPLWAINLLVVLSKGWNIMKINVCFIVVDI